MALVDWALIALAWVGLATAPSWVAPLLLLVITGRFHALGVVCHDACHLPPRRRKGASGRLLEVLCAYPLLTTISAMRYHHLRHHRANGLPEDPYLKTGAWRSRPRFVLLTLRGVLLLPVWLARVPWGVAAAWLPGLRPSYGRVFLQDRSEKDLRSSPEINKCAQEELGLLLFLIPLGALAWTWPTAALYGYVLPATLASVLAAFRLLREHDYEPNTDRSLATTVRSSYDHDLGWAGELLLAPHSVGCHLVHHLHPQVGLRHLRRVRRWYLQHEPSYPRPLSRWWPG